VDEDLLAFTTGLIALRHAHPVFRRRRWFQGRPLRGTPDIAWLKPDGSEMTEHDWSAAHRSTVGVFLKGQAIPSPDPRGRRILHASFLLLLNASPEPVKWTVSGEWGERWRRVLDTTLPRLPREGEEDEVSGEVLVMDRSVVLLRREDGPRDAGYPVEPDEGAAAARAGAGG